MAEVLKDRLEEVSGFELLSGAHEPNSEGQMCVMEAVAYVAGEEWSDSPACASPVIAAFMRSWNDSLDQEGRQRLKPYIPKLVGTAASQEVEERRSFMAGDWQVRVFTPAWLELAGVTEEAAALRELPPLMDLTAVKDSMPALTEAKKAGAVAGAVAGDAAWAAAGDAAKKKLEPTKVELQASAFELLDRMIEAGDSDV